ncbi:MAG: hypothetical protein EYC62_02500 [Alphaproteobacteria bacterium]|nr:MAG: hypothetical protein EYC62_02500 [Alphaproteobacteria bacterium]
MNLLSIAQNVAYEVGFEPPAFLYGNTDATARQILALCNREGKILARRHNWTMLQKEYDITTVGGQENYDLPDDFDRLIDNTLWDRSAYQSMRGPLSPQQWQQKKSGLIGSVGIKRNFRIKRGADIINQIYIDPVPPINGDALILEYVSQNWVRNLAGTQTSNVWQDDSDESILPENLVIMGVVWRFLLAKGLDYAMALQEYEREVSQAIARDGGMPKLNLQSNCMQDIALNLPEANF